MGMEWCGHQPRGACSHQELAEAGKGPPLRPQASGPASTVALDPRSPELTEEISFSATEFGAICLGSPRKLMEHLRMSSLYWLLLRAWTSILWDWGHARFS